MSCRTNTVQSSPAAANNPEAKRAQLQSQARCKILLVAVFDEPGHIEEWLHLQLQNFQIDKEWFTGCTDSRAAIARILKSSLNWPFEHNAATEGEWLKLLKEMRANRRWQRRENRILRNLKAARDGFGRFKCKEAGHHFLDARLADFHAICCFSTNRLATPIRPIRWLLPEAASTCRRKVVNDSMNEGGAHTTSRQSRRCKTGEIQDSAIAVHQAVVMSDQTHKPSSRAAAQR